MITLKLMGPVEVLSSDTSQVSALSSRPKMLSVLAYLASARPRGFLRRDAVITIFWPDRSQERARRSLRQSLHFLRSELGHEVVVSRGKEEVGVDRRYLSVDVFELEASIDRGDATSALDLYRGDFMQGFFLRGTPAFEDWIAGEQVRLRRALFVMTGDAIARAREAGGGREALSLAHRVAELRPDHEPSVRTFMSLCLDSGDRGTARRAYDRLARRLAEDFEVEPDLETQALAERLRQPSPSPGSVNRPGGHAVNPVAVLREAPVPPPPASTGETPRQAPEPADRRPILGAAAVIAVGVSLGSILGAPPSTDPTEDGPQSLASELVRSSEALTGPPLARNRNSVALLSEAVRLDASNGAAHARLSLALSSQVRVGGAPPALADSAERLARHAVDRAPSAALSWLALADALGAQGRLTEAASAFRGGLVQAPDHAWLHFGVGWYAFLQGDLTGALNSLEASLAAEPEAAPILAHIGALWLIAGHPDEADSWLAAAEDRMPEHPAVLDFRAAGHASAGRNAEAREVIDQWLRSQPDNAEGFAVGVRVALREGDWERAADLGRMGHLLRPDLRGAVGVTMNSAYGYALVRLGRGEEGRLLLREAIRSGVDAVERGDERPGVFFDVAAAYAGLEDAEAAVRWLRRAREHGWLHHDLVPMGMSQFELIRDEASYRAVMAAILTELALVRREVTAGR